jgi:hypothetical protein
MRVIQRCSQVVLNANDSSSFQGALARICFVERVWCLNRDSGLTTPYKSKHDSNGFWKYYGVVEKGFSNFP